MLEKLASEQSPETPADPVLVQEYFTVHIPQLTEQQAEALTAQYAGAWMTKEE